VTRDLVLACDPDPGIRRALGVILREAGYTVIGTRTGLQALGRTARDRPEAVILELLLPDMDGLELCRQLRERFHGAIIVLTELDDDASKIAALASGVDDYLTKPFSPGELVARLAARLRAASAALRFEADGLVIDLTTHRVELDGREIHLTPTEFGLLRVLATTRGTVTHLALVSSVWGPPPADPAPRVRTHIKNLRAKLDRNRDLIRTESGVGYRFARPAKLGRVASRP
jgi:two-component system, OmpR family, KDP operon response regulator KdpE